MAIRFWQRDSIPEVGRKWRRFTILRLLGTRWGGTSCFEAIHGPSKTEVALKCAPRTQQPLAHERIRTEATCLNALRGQGVANLIEFGRYRGTQFLATGWVDGRSLEQMVRELGPLSEEQVCVVIAHLLRILKRVHGLGWVHRDLQPANIIWEESESSSVRPSAISANSTVVVGDSWVKGTPKLIDFGLAQPVGSHGTEGIEGTPAFLSPERCNTKGAVAPTQDLYAIGCLAFYLLAGRAPFLGNNPIEVCWKQVHSAPPNIASLAPVSAPFAELVMRLLEKSPCERPATSDECLKLINIAPHRQ